MQNLCRSRWSVHLYPYAGYPSGKPLESISSPNLDHIWSSIGMSAEGAIQDAVSNNRPKWDWISSQTNTRNHWTCPAKKKLKTNCATHQNTSCRSREDPKHTLQSTLLDHESPHIAQLRSATRSSIVIVVVHQCRGTDHVTTHRAEQQLIKPKPTPHPS
jgi:hypothetical protein